MAVRTVLLASPRGFCAGVARAVQAVEDALTLCGAPVYVKHEIVHNRHVVAALAAKGAVTVEALQFVPERSVVVFSAHGSTPEQYTEAKKRALTLIDATCPLVTKVHLEVIRYLKDGYQIIYIGHRGHIEGIGVVAEGRGVTLPLVETVEDVVALDIGQPQKIVYLTQTTLSIDDTAEVIQALKLKYPHITAPPLSDICYATTNRQEAVRALSAACDVVFILGSQNSSNSKRLMETARKAGTSAYLIDDAFGLDPAWYTGATTVGVSAGASAPEEKVQELLDVFRTQGASIEDFIVKPEQLKFSEPIELMRLKRERL